jgi:hypothetical protein
MDHVPMVMTEITAIKGANEAVDVTASFKSSPARVGNPSKPSLFSSLDFFNWSSSLFAPPSPSPRGCANLGGGFGAAAESDDPNGDFTAFATFANGLLLLLLLVPSPFSSSLFMSEASLMPLFLNSSANDIETSPFFSSPPLVSSSSSSPFDDDDDSDDTRTTTIDDDFLLLLILLTFVPLNWMCLFMLCWCECCPPSCDDDDDERYEFFNNKCFRRRPVVVVV